MRLGLEYCVHHNLLPVTLEADFLSLKKIVDGIWEISWGIMMEIKRIKMLMDNKEVVVENIFREGKQLAEFYLTTFSVFKVSKD